MAFSISLLMFCSLVLKVEFQRQKHVLTKRINYEGIFLPTIKKMTKLRTASKKKMFESKNVLGQYEMFLNCRKD